MLSSSEEQTLRLVLAMLGHTIPPPSPIRAAAREVDVLRTQVALAHRSEYTAVWVGDMLYAVCGDEEKTCEGYIRIGSDRSGEHASSKALPPEPMQGAAVAVKPAQTQTECENLTRTVTRASYAAHAAVQTDPLALQLENVEAPAAPAAPASHKTEAIMEAPVLKQPCLGLVAQADSVEREELRKAETEKSGAPANVAQAAQPTHLAIDSTGHFNPLQTGQQPAVANEKSFSSLRDPDATSVSGVAPETSAVGSSYPTGGAARFLLPLWPHRISHARFSGHAPKLLSIGGADEMGARNLLRLSVFLSTALVEHRPPPHRRRYEMRRVSQHAA